MWICLQYETMLLKVCLMHSTSSYWTKCKNLFHSVHSWLTMKSTSNTKRALLQICYLNSNNIMVKMVLPICYFCFGWVTLMMSVVILWEYIFLQREIMKNLANNVLRLMKIQMKVLHLSLTTVTVQSQQQTNWYVAIDYHYT